MIYNIAESELIKVHGRTAKGENSNLIFWSNSGIEFNIKANNAYLNIECDYKNYEQWITIEINGAFISRLCLNKGMNKICIMHSFNNNNKYNVRVLRDSQPFAWNNECLRFVSLETDGELLPVDEPKLRLEFYGDSITSGEGTVGARWDYDFNTTYICSYYSYPRMLARKLNADIQVMSQCGWGVVSSWDNNPSCSVPAKFFEVCSAIDKSAPNGGAAYEPYDFAKFNPDAVIINLGTNDNTAFNQPPKTLSDGSSFKQDKNNPEHLRRFVDTAKTFIKNIRSKRENAAIIWAFGIIRADFTAELIKQAIEEYEDESGDKNVYYLPLIPMGDDEYGSRSHPGIPAHERAARQIESFLKDNDIIE